MATTTTTTTTTTSVTPKATTAPRVRFAGLALTVALAGCSRPRPPTITPRTVEVTQITGAGLGLRVTLTANNPNRFPISTQGVSARVTLAGRDLGTTQNPAGINLAPGVDTTFTSDLSVGWMDLPGLLAATVMNPSLPYHVDGTVDLGRGDWRARVPFAMDGSIPRAQVMSAAMNSVLPGITMPGMPLPVVPGASGGALPAIPPLPLPLPLPLPVPQPGAQPGGS